VTVSSPSGPAEDRRTRFRGGLVGAGAAACAVCCTAPLLTLLGIGVTGATATALTLTVAGLVFGVGVAVATIAALVVSRRQGRRNACRDAAAGKVTGPVRLELLDTPPDRI
jgi:hypothetical protein